MTNTSYRRFGRVDYTVDPYNITNAGIQKPSKAIIKFLKKYPYLGNKIQELIDNSNQPLVSNLIFGLKNVPNKLAKILDKSNILNLANIIKNTNTSFIVDNFLANKTDYILKAIEIGKIDVFFSRIRGFFRDKVDSILNSLEERKPKETVMVERIETKTLYKINEADELVGARTTNKTILEERPATEGYTTAVEEAPTEENYTIKNFLYKFKGLDDKVQFLIKNSSEKKVEKLITRLTFTPIRLANIIQKCNLENFSNILNNNNSLSKMISDIKSNSADDILYAIENGKLPGIIHKTKSGIIHKTKGFFRKKALSFLGIDNNTSGNAV